VQDYQRIGWYTLGGALITLGGGWAAIWGDTVASAKKDSATHFLIPITYAALAGGVVGFLIIFAVTLDWPSKLSRRVKRHQKPRQQPADEPEGSVPPLSPPQRDTQGTTSLRDFRIGEDSDFKLGSSADVLADGGGLSGRAKFDAQHFPGHPELFRRGAEPQDE
jgi:hypothetical protein